MVENRVNALAFPRVANSFVLGGLGNVVGLLRYLSQVHRCASIHYRGDIDAQGFEILSQFRRWLPSVESMLMNRAPLDLFSTFQVLGSLPLWEETLPISLLRKRRRRPKTNRLGACGRSCSYQQDIEPDWGYVRRPFVARIEGSVGSFAEF